MIKLSIEGIGEIKETLDNIVQSVSDFKPEMEEIGAYLKGFYQDVPFATQGGFWGVKWADLSPRYKRWKAKKFPGRGILEATGKMRRSFKYESFTDRAIIENVADYFIYHQLGTKRMPQRLVMDINDLLKNKIIELFRKTFTEKWRR